MAALVLAFGARFEQLAQRDQGENNGGRFEIIRLADHIAEAEEQPQQHNHAVDIGRD